MRTDAATLRKIAPAILGLLVLPWLGAVPALPAEMAETRLIAESPDELIFEVRSPRPQVTLATVNGGDYLAVDFPGAAHPAQSGVPDLPYTEHWVAVPWGTTAVATVVEAQAQPLAAGRPLPVPERRILGLGARPAPEEELPRFESEYFEDPQAYASPGPYPPVLAAAAPARSWRDLRVAPLALHAVQYDAGRGALVWYPRLVVRVIFAPGGSSPAGSMRAAIARGGRWDALIERHLLNPASARGFRAAPALRAFAFGDAPRAAAEFRIEVPRSGVYSLPHAELAATGWQGDLPWSELRMVVRDYEDADSAGSAAEWPVAILPQDSDQDGLFGAGESLIFYAQDAWEFFGLTPGERRYGRGNVYWLVSGAGPGVAMEARPSWYDWNLPDPPATFLRKEHFEDNFWYMPNAARGTGGDVRSPTPGPFAVRTDHYNWTYYLPSWVSERRPVQAVLFRLPAMLDASEVCVRLQGQYQSDYGHRPRLWLSRSPSVALDAVWEDDWAFPGNPYQVSNLGDLTVCLDGAGIPASVLSKGDNYLKIYLPSEGDGRDNVDADGIGVDWIEVTYRGLFEIRDRRLLAVLTGLSGQQELMIKIPGPAGAPPTNELWAFDLTDSLAPALLTLTDGQFTYKDSARRWELGIQIDCASGSPPRKLLFIERDALAPLPPGAVARRDAAARDAFSGQDYVAVYPQRFAAALEPLLEHRESQGHRVLRASVEGLYDSYSGGRPHPFAIKRLLREMWRASDPPPEYLLLFGDASNDIAGYALGLTTEAADTNWVPTPTIVGPWNELIACDQWYVDGLAEPWGAAMSYLPDLHFGRVPCGSVEEAGIYVAKVLAYEREDLDASWRDRIVMVTDDAFSSRISGISGSGSYEYQGSEVSFLNITRRSANSFLGDSLFSYFGVDSIYLNIAMDSLAVLGRCLPDSVDPTRCLCRELPWPWPRDRCYHLGGIDYVINKSYGEGSGAYQGAGLRAELLSRLGRGALVWAFQGHSNRSLLTHEYIFRHSPLAGRTDVFDLTNLRRPFVFMGFGCHLADFSSHWEGDRRRGDAMEETLLLCCGDQARGAIGALASVDYEWIGHDYEEKVFAAMFSDPPRDPRDPERPSRWRLGEWVSHSKAMVAETDRSERLTYTLLGDPALRVGLAPPSVRLSLNGVAWDGAGGGEYVSPAENEDDTLSVLIRIADPTRVTLQAVHDYYGVVPADSLTILDGDDDRILTARYRTQVQRRPYQIRVTASDYDGSQREVAVDIPMAVGLYEDLGGELFPLASGSALGDTASLAVTVRCAAHLQPEDVLLLADGVALEQREATLDGPEGEPFFWTVRFRSLRGLPTGPLTLSVRIAQHDGTPLELVATTVELGRVDVRFAEQPFWMPNPFDGEAYLVYNLTAPSRRTRLRIFTAAGRRIFEDAALPTQRAVRHFRWDGRDADGDPVGNGLYFYELAIWNDRDELADRVIDKVVRVR